MNSLYPSGPPQSGPSYAQPVPPVRIRVELPSLRPYVTYSIIGVTVAVFALQVLGGLLQGQVDILTVLGAKINNAIRAGQWWRLITPVLLHASIPHIFFNMYSLWVFGRQLEGWYGHGRYLLLYALAGFAGNVLSFLLSSGYSVGASTAIFGLVGAEAVFLLQNRELLGRNFARAIGNIAIVVILNLAIGLTPGIDMWGHVGGLLGGALFAAFAGPVFEMQQSFAFNPLDPTVRLADRRTARDLTNGAIIVLLVFGVITAYAIRFG